MFAADVFAQSLQPHKSGMPLIVVKDLRTDAEGPESADTAYAQKQLLLEPVFPVSAIEMIGYLPVIGPVGLKIGVEQIEVGAAHGHLPDSGSHRPAGEGHGGSEPVAVLVAGGLGGNLQEILSVIFGLLLALGGEDLIEIAIPVKKAHGAEVHVHVAGLLEVVAGEDSKSAGIYLEGGVQTIFHAEISDGRVGPFALERHVPVELRHDAAQVVEKLLILGKLVEALAAHGVQNGHGIVDTLVPHVGIYGFEKRLGVFVPAPPEVLGEFLKT